MKHLWNAWYRLLEAVVCPYRGHLWLDMTVVYDDGSSTPIRACARCVKWEETCPPESSGTAEIIGDPSLN